MHHCSADDGCPTTYEIGYKKNSPVKRLLDNDITRKVLNKKFSKKFIGSEPPNKKDMLRLEKSG